MALKEMRIKGSMARIDALKAPFEDWCPREALVKFMQAHGELADAVTGGQFTAIKREGSAEGAFKVQLVAAELIATVRYSLRHGFGFRAEIDRKFRKS